MSSQGYIGLFREWAVYEKTCLYYFLCTSISPSLSISLSPHIHLSLFISLHLSLHLPLSLHISIVPLLAELDHLEVQHENLDQIYHRPQRSVLRD